MYNKILVAMALDHNVSEKTIAIARQMLSDGGTITALHVVEEPQGTAALKLREDLLEQGTARAQELFQEKLASHADIEQRMVQGHPARTVVEEAEKLGADLIVMGSHMPGLRDFFLGSTASRVTSHARCAVHVYRAD